MNSRERLLTALEGGVPDRLPATTHHVLPYFLDKYLDGMDYQKFFDRFGLDPIKWVIPLKANDNNRDYIDPQQGEPGFIEQKRIVSDEWKIEWEELKDPKFDVKRYSFITPEDTLTMTIKTDEASSMVTEYLIKEKEDIELLGKYMTHPVCDNEEVNRAAQEFKDRGIVRGHIPTFDVFGQPGCWQDAACLVGIEELIMATFEDPAWVHELLSILQKRKIDFIKSMDGANYDLLELGGGHASTTIISPDIFNRFVAPYDSELIEAAHQVGQKIVYHTCGGMMPILEDIAAMKPDAMETFTPPNMGGDVKNLAEAKERIGDKVCMIGGFDQYNYFNNCSPEETRDAVKNCFERAGKNGGYIMAPSDHFFDAELNLLEVYADEASKCRY
ncbi:MAG: uroporphyrinogen decarboxylase family protein [Bacillota bacterium]